jgi:hypothetical protein
MTLIWIIVMNVSKAQLYSELTLDIRCNLQSAMMKFGGLRRPSANAAHDCLKDPDLAIASMRQETATANLEDILIMIPDIG